MDARLHSKPPVGHDSKSLREHAARERLVPGLVRLLLTGRRLGSWRGSGRACLPGVSRAVHQGLVCAPTAQAGARSRKGRLGRGAGGAAWPACGRALVHGRWRSRPKGVPAWRVVDHAQRRRLRRSLVAGDDQRPFPEASEARAADRKEPPAFQCRCPLSRFTVAFLALLSFTRTRSRPARGRPSRPQQPRATRSFAEAPAAMAEPEEFAFQVGVPPRRAAGRGGAPRRVKARQPAQSLLDRGRPLPPPGLHRPGWLPDRTRNRSRPGRRAARPRGSCQLRLQRIGAPRGSACAHARPRPPPPDPPSPSCPHSRRRRSTSCCR